jgi:ketosteroid isomerase-like protein
VSDVILNLAQARALAEGWIAAWNARDLDGILAHYADDVVFSSPLVVTRYGEASGVLRGKAALRQYFRGGLEAIGATIQFKLLDVLAGVNGYTIYYSRESGATVVDTAIVNAEGKAIAVHAHYHAAEPSVPADAPQAARR